MVACEHLALYKNLQTKSEGAPRQDDSHSWHQKLDWRLRCLNASICNYPGYGETLGLLLFIADDLRI